MSEWKEGVFSDIADIIMGQSPQSDTCNTCRNGKPLLNGPTEFGIKSPSPVQFTTKATKVCKVGDILFCVRGSTTGRMNLADQEYIIGRGIAAIRHKKGNDYQAYIKGILAYNLPSLLASATGSTFPNVSREQLQQLDIFLPPLPEQKAIAAVLSSLDDKIDFLHRQNKTLEAMAETLFRQWFVEEADEGWEEGTIGELIDFNPTRQLAKGNIAPYLEMASLSTSTFMPIEWREREFSSGMKFVNGDTLLARITPCLENGKTAFITFLQEGETGWGSTEYIVMRSKDPIHPFFAYVLARTSDFRDYAVGCLEGTSGRQRVNVDHLMKYPISIPDSQVITLFSNFAQEIVPKLNYNAKQICTLEKLRDTLLPKLMSGEVRVEL